MAFMRRCTVEILSGQITGTLPNFPVTIIAQHNDLKLIAYGGYVTQKEEIRVLSDAPLTTATPFYRLFYDGATGLFIADALLSSAAVGSKLYLGFGDAALTSEASSSSTYPTALTTVIPMLDGTTLSVADLSQAGNNATNHGPVATSGMIGSGAALFDGVNDYISLPPQYGGTDVTVSAVINTNVNNAVKAILIRRSGMTGESDPAFEGWALYLTAAGKIRWLTSTQNGSGLNNDQTGSTTLSTGANYVVHGTCSNGDTRGYLDGVLDTPTGGIIGDIYNSGTHIHVGDDSSSGRFFDGKVQFVRIWGVAKSADWVAAEAKMWKTASSFASYTFDAAPSGGGPIVGGGSLIRSALLRGGRLAA